MGRRRHEIVGAIHTQVAAGEQIKKQLQSELTRAHRLAIQEALGAPPQLSSNTLSTRIVMPVVSSPEVWYHDARLCTLEMMLPQQSNG